MLKSDLSSGLGGISFRRRVQSRDMGDFELQG